MSTPANIILVIVCVTLWISCSWLSYEAGRGHGIKNGDCTLVILALVMGPIPLMLVLYWRYILVPIKNWLDKPMR